MNGSNSAWCVLLTNLKDWFVWFTIAFESLPALFWREACRKTHSSNRHGVVFLQLFVWGGMVWTMAHMGLSNLFAQELGAGQKFSRELWENGVGMIVEARRNVYLGRYLEAETIFEQLMRGQTLPYLWAEAADWLGKSGRYNPEGKYKKSQAHQVLLSAVNEVVLYVSSLGGAGGNGTFENPFGSIEEALSVVRMFKRQGRWPIGGVAIVLKPGRYYVTNSLVVGSSESGSELGPLVIRGTSVRDVIVCGGIRVTNLVPLISTGVEDARVRPDVRHRIWVSDLSGLGISNVPGLVLGGCASGRGFKTHPVWEVFWDGMPLPIARWPNSGFARITGVNLLKPVYSHGRVGSQEGVIHFKSQRVVDWASESEGWLHGYWFWDWADSYEKIQSVDVTNYLIRFEPPVHTYGFRTGQPFRAVNMLCELDEPGEWYIDRRNRRLYVWPPSSPARAEVWLSVFRDPFIVLSNASYVRIETITFEYGAGDGIHIVGGKGCEVAGCIVRNCGGDGITVRGGTNHVIRSCDIYNLGRGGVILEGGDRRRLVPASHRVNNCYIHHISRIDRTYTPAVLVKGVGHVIDHNVFHDVNSSALRVDGNDHLIEFNEVFRVVLESDDQGGVDMWGDPTYRGVTFRYNYFHHIGGWANPMREPELGRAGIRLDDAISGVVVYGNVFFRASAGKRGFGAVQIHGGKENILDNNLFIDCRAAVSLSPWTTNFWLDFVRGRLSKGDIDARLYLKRYPDLARLEEGPNINFFSRNVVINCGVFILRDDSRQICCHNLVSDNNPGIDEIAPGTFRIRPGNAELTKIGFHPIPFDEIGLYQDRYRVSIPYDVIRAARAEGGPSSLTVRR